MSNPQNDHLLASKNIAYIRKLLEDLDNDLVRIDQELNSDSMFFTGEDIDSLNARLVSAMESIAVTQKNINQRQP